MRTTMGITEEACKRLGIDPKEVRPPRDHPKDVRHSFGLSLGPLKASAAGRHMPCVRNDVQRRQEDSRQARDL